MIANLSTVPEISSELDPILHVEKKRATLTQSLTIAYLFLKKQNKDIHPESLWE